jgi:predicted transcriptional regulator
VAESRRFLEARRNSFPSLDDAAERLAARVAEHDSLTGYFKARHNLRVRRLPPEVLVGSTRRLDQHRREIVLSDELDNASQSFQLALQLAYLELAGEVDGPAGRRQLRHRQRPAADPPRLGELRGAALLMPYGPFARAVEARRYDVEALSRQFGASFEQVAHRLTDAAEARPGRVPFFFIRVDEAGNISKRLDGAGFPFARHGGGCPLWNVHQAFARRARSSPSGWSCPTASGSSPSPARSPPAAAASASRGWSAPSPWGVRPSTLGG